MPRNAQQTTHNLTNQQLAQQNQATSLEGQFDTQDRSLLMPTMQSLLNSQGYIRSSSRPSPSKAWAHRTRLLMRCTKKPQTAPPRQTIPPAMAT
jgi:hypothetical protein